jgi:hypothetical protein
MQAPQWFPAQIITRGLNRKTGKRSDNGEKSDEKNVLDT